MTSCKTILVTGGAGFIGANFVEYLLEHRPGLRIVDLDAMTYAAHPEAAARQQASGRVTVVRGDIGDPELVAKTLQDHDVDGIVHFAAESHVDNSIADPLRFVRTNVDGTANLLRCAHAWWTKRGTLKESRFHHISTDEVYGSLGAEGFFTETTPYAPNSPYSASKASSDFLVRAWVHTFGLNATISNCSNNYGPWQHREKLIPTILRKCLAHESIPVYGTGTNVRDWLWVKDHCSAVATIFEKARPGETYNVGGHNERNNLQIVETVTRILDELLPWAGHRYQELQTFVADRPGHDFRYAIDPSKIGRDLGWKPEVTFDEGIRRTVAWYLGEGREILGV